MGSGTARSTSVTRFVAAAIVAMVGVRLLFLGEPTGRDEAGYLIVGSAWHDGSSVYGDYWVDRPPLLLWIADLAGSVVALRLVGLLACALMVVGVSRAAFVAHGPAAARWAGGAAALLSTAQWFGVTRTNGEMLAAPFVAGSMALACQALLRPGRGSRGLALGAGVLAGCACLVKQTIADGLVFALVLGVAVAWQHRERRREVVATLATVVGGAVAVVAVGLLAATTRGTDLPDLFDATVTFRARAGEVIRTSATSATTDRLWLLAATWAASGLALVTGLSLWQAARRRDPALVAAAGVIVFVSGAAILGGSYWGHYLFQLVPAAALAAGLVLEHLHPRARVAVAASVLAATAGNLAWSAVEPPHEGRRAEAVGGWLRESGRPGDTAVVAYGQPNVLGNARMDSPYPYLWSLPVRTLDPDLSMLSTVLEGPDRPTWFVDWSGIRSWGIDPARVTRALGQHYEQVADVCGRTVWLDRRARRALAPVGGCP